jgi:hypothetical protein
MRIWKYDSNWWWRIEGRTCRKSTWSVYYKWMDSGKQIISEEGGAQITMYYVCIYIYIYRPYRTQWPCGLRHELSSPALTLGSWVSIPLQVWIFFCIYSVFVVSYVCIELATSWTPIQGNRTTIYTIHCIGLRNEALYGCHVFQRK